MVEPVLVARGAAFRVFALRNRPDHPSLLLQFVRGREKDDGQRVLTAVRRLAEYGPPRNLTKCRDIKGEPNLFELKQGQCRLMWFYSRQRRVIIITHGFYKKRNRTSPEEIARAVRLREDYFRRYR